MVNTETYATVQEVAVPAALHLAISPRNTLLATWQPYRQSQGQTQGDPNLCIWDIKSGRLVKSFIQKKHETWEPQWSADEVICARNVNNEVHFFENNDFDKIAQKLHLQKVADYKIAKNGKAPYSVAAYAPGSKGQPSFVRLYRYPNFVGLQSALANKSFYNADRVQMIWNRKGTEVLALTASDVSADSYYGDQGLHFLSTSGASCLVPRDKNGPVYSVEWSPDSAQFCVVYGFMPAKAALYNVKCERVFDFGTGPRNVVYYNPFGNLMCLAGFGNLNGNMEMWDLENKRRIVQYRAADSTYFEWCPDGVHLLTATTAPRLRVGNGYKIWTATGALVHEYTSTGPEVWDVTWQGAPEGRFSKPRLDNLAAAPQTAAPKKYVPPAMRGRSEAELKSKFREDDEPASNVRQQQSEPKSKSAMKNAKKREAKKRTQAAQPDTATSTAAPPAPAPACSNPDSDKKLKNLHKKLQQIEKLKEKMKAGEQLEKNQMDKIKTEDSLLEELENLQLGV